MNERIRITFNYFDKEGDLVDIHKVWVNKKDVAHMSAEAIIRNLAPDGEGQPKVRHMETENEVNTPIVRKGEI